MNFSPEKLFLVGIIALVVLGPNRLPQAARTAGRLLAEFRRVSAGLQSEVTSALAEPRDALHQAVGEFGLSDARSSIRSTINEVVAGSTGRPTGGSSVDGGAVGAPIVYPGDAIEAAAPPSTGPRPVPLPPDDPSFN